MNKGRVYRRCSCRGEDGRQLGARCPLLLSDRKHGAWTFAVDVPSVDGRRKTMRRSGYPTKGAAQRALSDVLARYRVGVKVDDRETVAGYLPAWLNGKRHALKPKTLHRYTEIVTKELIPALGALPLEQLCHEHVAAFIAELEDAGRGAPTIRYVHAVLSSALSDAVKRRRLTHNVAQHVVLPPVVTAEREPWTAAEAVAFLDHAHRADDRLTDLFEVIIGTGLRRGEALALHWSDLDLPARVLFIHPTRGTLSDVAGRLMFTAPKTRGSVAGVGLSSRVVAALKRQSARQVVERAEWDEAYEDDDLVFARENGAPLRPDWVLDRFHDLTEAAGLPRVRLHDLRHLAATLMITSGVPLPLVSKTLRHAQTGITADLYGHLTAEAALAAADSLGAVLDAAAAELVNERVARAATTLRPQDHDPRLLSGSVCGETAGQTWSRLGESNPGPAHYE
ncbi:MAG: site-specific integrase [Pseudonocardiaceae bacterium]